MLIQPRTIEDLKEDFILAVRNNCGDKITKVSPLGVFNGFAYGLARLVQKINSDSALLESFLFPDFAYGDTLDTVATHIGALSIARIDATNSEKLDGWIDELRISVGKARWTAAFTPPTQPY